MTIELVQAIKLKDTNNGIKSIHKYIETDIKPGVGDYITNDTFWKSPYEYKVNHVELDLLNNEVRVVLDDMIVYKEEDIERMEECAVDYHGWKPGGFTFG